MTWNLAGSYSETCSCELMCPCNMSFDHEATDDFCRAVLAFSIHDGSVDGTDIFVDFHNRPAGPARAHEVRLQGGDCTTEIFQ